MRTSLALVAFLLPAGTLGAQPLQIDLVQVASGLELPVAVANAGDGSGRLFIVEQPGEIRILENGTLLSPSFLNIRGLVFCCGERGLLGLALHPEYESNGYFYVNYTDNAGDTVIARYSVSGNPDVAEPGSALTLLTVAQPAPNHNGGQLAFGPDGYLYIALGDGGGGGDPGDRAQNLSTLLGKILRIDVDGDDFPGDPNRNYAIPEDNPFVGQDGRDEIWAYGLRNPWRFSFDRMTGDLWIADVGQGMWEEIDFQPADDPGGNNYGWDVLEGGLQPGTPGPSHPNCFENDPGGDGSCADFLTGASVLPVLEYNHTLGCSVTGGFRYRGVAQPQLFGVFLFADFCSGRIWGTLPNCEDEVSRRLLLQAPFNITTFGEDEAGEIYLTEYAGGSSKLHRVIVTAGGPVLDPAPNALAFGVAEVGDVRTAELTVSHAGSGPGSLVIEELLLSDEENFSVDPGAGTTPCGPTPICLNHGASCTMNVTFAPLREGGFNETLSFVANAPPAPVALTGEVACTGPDFLVIENQTVDDREFFAGCITISAGSNFVIAPTGDAELRAGEEIVLGSGTSVQAGGRLSVVIDPVLAQ